MAGRRGGRGKDKGERLGECQKVKGYAGAKDRARRKKGVVTERASMGKHLCEDKAGAEGSDSEGKGKGPHFQRTLVIAERVEDEDLHEVTAQDVDVDEGLVSEEDVEERQDASEARAEDDEHQGVGIKLRRMAHFASQVGVGDGKQGHAVEKDADGT